jgi:hypothetical protein
MTPEEQRSRWSAGFNFDLVLTEVGRWPWATTAVISLAAAMVVIAAINEGRAEPLYLVINAIMVSVCLIGLKALMHLMAYATLYKRPFPGSFLIATAIAMIPLHVFFACGFYVLGVEQGELFPVFALLVLVGVGYPLFTLFFAGAFRVNQEMQLAQQRWLAKRRAAQKG